MKISNSLIKNNTAMTANYEPKQELKFLYRRSERKVFVLDNITIDKPPSDDLFRTSPNPSLIANAETDVNFKVKIKDEPNPFKDRVEIPVMENINLKEPDLKDKIKAHICKNLLSRGICFYTVKSQVRLLDGSNGKQKTATISGDGEIEIDERLSYPDEVSSEV